MQEAKLYLIFEFLTMDLKKEPNYSNMYIMNYNNNKLGDNIKHSFVFASADLTGVVLPTTKSRIPNFHIINLSL